MGHTPHELAQELPEFAEVLSMAKTDFPHLAALADRYHTINRDIHRAETHVEPTDDLHLEELKKRRLQLLDEIKHIAETSPS